MRLAASWLWLGSYRLHAPLFSLALCSHSCSTSDHAMAYATGDTNDQELEDQLKDHYGKLGFYRDTDGSQRLRLRTDGPGGPSPTCLALEDLITLSRRTFCGRRNSKALIRDMPRFLDNAMEFVRGYVQRLSPIEHSNTLSITKNKEKFVFNILLLEGEKARRGQ